MQKQKIKSLKALKREKQLLKARMEISKQEFSNTAGRMGGNVKSFFFNKVALPASLLGLTAFSLKHGSNNHHPQQEYQTDQPQEKPNFLLQALTMALPLIENYLKERSLRDN